MNKLDQIIANQILTPDGTILRSHHRHDYVSYVDKNGEEYMVDGGTDYLRRSVNTKYPAKDITVYASDPHSAIREAFMWGTRGVDGNQPLVRKYLKDLDTDHVEAILETQHHISDCTREVFQNELKYRKGININE